MGLFEDWMVPYAGVDEDQRISRRYANDRVYHLADEAQYGLCIIDFLSGMTDTFAMRAFDEVTTF